MYVSYISQLIIILMGVGKGWEWKVKSEDVTMVNVENFDKKKYK